MKAHCRYTTANKPFFPPFSFLHQFYKLWSHCSGSLGPHQTTSRDSQEEQMNLISDGSASFILVEVSTLGSPRLHTLAVVRQVPPKQSDSGPNWSEQEQERSRWKHPDAAPNLSKGRSGHSDMDGCFNGGSAPSPLPLVIQTAVPEGKFSQKLVLF